LIFIAGRASVSFSAPTRPLWTPLSRSLRSFGLVDVSHRFRLGHRPVLDQLGERLVEGLHAVVVARGRHRLLDRAGLALPDQLPDLGRIDHDLHRGDPAVAVRPAHEPLAHDRLQRQRHLRPDLAVRVRRERRDDPSIVCFESFVWRSRNTRWPVSAACIASSMVSGSRISPIEDDVRVLAQHPPQRLPERLHVAPELPLRIVHILSV
jgi:hypothetical protein